MSETIIVTSDDDVELEINIPFYLKMCDREIYKSNGNDLICIKYDGAIFHSSFSISDFSYQTLIDSLNSQKELEKKFETRRKESIEKLNNL